MNLNKIRELSEPLTDLRRTVKFTATSLIGLGLETAILMLLVELFSSPLIMAKLVGAEASIAAMFFLNNKFTYTGGAQKLLTRFLKSNAVRAGGIAISIIVLEIGVAYGVWYPLANILGVCIGFGFNYGLETLYTWKEHKQV